MLFSCPQESLSQSNNGTIQCDVPLVLYPDDQLINIPITEVFFTDLFVTFDGDIFLGLMKALFVGLAVGFGGGLILNVLRKGRNL